MSAICNVPGCNKGSAANNGADVIAGWLCEHHYSEWMKSSEWMRCAAAHDDFCRRTSTEERIALEMAIVAAAPVGGTAK